MEIEECNDQKSESYTDLLCVEGEQMQATSRKMQITVPINEWKLLDLGDRNVPDSRVGLCTCSSVTRVKYKIHAF